MEQLSSLATDSPGQLDIFGHDSDTLGMDGTQVGVLKQSNQVSFRCLLKSSNSSWLEPEISFEVLGNLSHQTLEGQLSDEQLSWLLVSSNLTEGDGSRPVSMRLLDSTSWRSGLSGSLCSELLPWSLSSSRFSSCLLCTGHFIFEISSSCDTCL